MLGIIKRNFNYVTITGFVLLYKYNTDRRSRLVPKPHNTINNVAVATRCENKP